MPPTEKMSQYEIAARKTLFFIRLINSKGPEYRGCLQEVAKEGLRQIFLREYNAHVARGTKHWAWSRP